MGGRIQKIFRNSAVGMLAALFPVLLQAQSDTLALAPGTCEGVLPNGLHYILRQNPTPASRIEFRLVLRAGSVQELDREKGCAHFLEHVAFGGSRHFPGKSMQRYLETLGMKYGVDINAFTSQDRTIYLFAVPTDTRRPGVIDSALLILRDWMEGLEINPERVETERGIILEELRGYDVGDPFYDLKIGEGIHTRRLPLGTVEDIRRIAPATLAKYYRKWYVPELATIVAVGDLDTAVLERKIRERFASLPPRKAPGFKVHPLEYAPGTRIAEICDSLHSRTQLEVMIPHRGISVRRSDDAVAKAREELLVDAVSARMRGRGIRTTVSDEWYLSDKNHFTVTASGTSRQELLEELAKLSSALHDLADKGWDDAELEEIRMRRRARIARYEVDAPQCSAAWCEDFTDYILSGDRPIRDTALYRRIVDSMAATPGSLLQEMLRQRLACYDSAVRIACSSHPGLGAPLRAAEIDEAWHRGAQTPCEPYIYEPRQCEPQEPEEPETPACLAVRPPFDPAAIVSTRDYPNIRVREAVLTNGMRLIMRPTPGGGKVLFTYIAPFGSSSISDECYPLFEGTAGYMEMGGIAKVDAQEISEYLYRNDMALGITLENHWHGFMGMTPEETLPEFFNLVREKIFDPELRYDEFEELRGEMAEEQEESLLSRMLQRASDRQLTARMNEFTGATVPRPESTLPREEVVRRLSLDSIADFYHRLYTPTEGACAVVTGDFNPDTMLCRFAAAFAPIPARSHGREFGYKVGQMPGQRLVEGFDNNNDTQTLFDYLYLGRYEPSLRGTLKLKIMRDILRNRLIMILRERESLVYSPFISLFYEGIPAQTFCFDINASADNRNMEAIDSLLHTIISDLQAKPVSSRELDNLKRSFRIAKRETLADDAASDWRNILVGIIRNGERVEDFDNYDRILDAITPDELREDFARLIDPRNYVLLYLSKERLKNDTSDR